MRMAEVRAPPRRIPTTYDRPDVAALNWPATALADIAGFPSTSATTSPEARPAISALLPGVTPPTRTPSPTCSRRRPSGACDVGRAGATVAKRGGGADGADSDGVERGGATSASAS